MADDNNPFVRVFSSELEPHVCWYAVRPSLSLGNLSRLTDLNALKVLPGFHTVREVEIEQLKLENGDKVQPGTFGKSYKSSKVAVITTFGMVCALLRKKTITGQEPLFTSEKFQSTIHNLIGVDISQCDELQMETPPYSPAKPTDQTSNKKPNANISSRDFQSLESDKSLRTPVRKRRMKRRVKNVLGGLQEITEEKFKETLTSIITYACKYGQKENKIIVSDVIDELAMKVGVKQALKELVSSETLQRFFKSMRSPDWVQLYLKVQSRIPDHQWQTLLNLTRLGPSKVRSNMTNNQNAYMYSQCKSISTFHKILRHASLRGAPHDFCVTRYLVVFQALCRDLDILNA